ncbi:hypothetical protein INR49_017430 [Caranx melampygus]|nr:hypothetical protein INR49_017430 [Caranx melampygus]
MNRLSAPQISVQSRSQGQTPGRQQLKQTTQLLSCSSASSSRADTDPNSSFGRTDMTGTYVFILTPPPHRGFHAQVDCIPVAVLVGGLSL